MLLIGLALMVSGLEMVGALLVYTLLALVADPDGAIDLSLVGDLRQRFDGVGDDTLLLSVVGAMAVFFLVRVVVKIPSKYVQARVAHNAGARLSTRMFDGYLRWPYPRHLSRTTSELIRNGHRSVSGLVSNVVLPTIRTVAELLIVGGLLIVLTLPAPLVTLGAVLVIGSAAVGLLLLVQPRLSARSSASTAACSGRRRRTGRGRTASPAHAPRTIVNAKKPVMKAMSANSNTMLGSCPAASRR